MTGEPLPPVEALENIEPGAGGLVVSARRRRGILRSRSATVGAAIVAVFLVIGCAGLILLVAPGLEKSWKDQDLANALKGPLYGGHILGTDNLGRDLLARTTVGVGVSFLIAFVVTVVSLVLGVTVGLIAGYFRGPIDTFFSALTDVTWGFPVILLAVMFAGMIEPGMVTIILAVALLSWAGVARIIRGYALSLREREFVGAAQAIGIPSYRIILVHLLPNVVAPILVLASYYIAVTIVIEAGLSFLGLGVQPPVPSLGTMLSQGRDFIRLSPWQTLLPGAVLALAVLGFNLLGDGLRDLFDPRLSRPQG
jgi:peptide/nickel transport system permease protein